MQIMGVCSSLHLQGAWLDRHIDCVSRFVRYFLEGSAYSGREGSSATILPARLHIQTAARRKGERESLATCCCAVHEGAMPVETTRPDPPTNTTLIPWPGSRRRKRSFSPTVRDWPDLQQASRRDAGWELQVSCSLQTRLHSKRRFPPVVCRLLAARAKSAYLGRPVADLVKGRAMLASRLVTAFSGSIWAA